MKRLFKWIYAQDNAGKTTALLFSIIGFFALVNFTIGFAVTPKPWYQQAIGTIIGVFAGGGAGLVAGLLIGGIGLAFAGTAIGIAGWLAFGIFGAGAGAFLGSIVSIVTNPGGFNFSALKLCFVLAFAGAMSFSIYALVTYCFRKNQKIDPEGETGIPELPSD